MLALPIAAYFLWPRDDTEALQEWVENQKFIFLVPARGGFLPGDIVEWPKANPGTSPTGDVTLYERSAEVLGENADEDFLRTGPSNVTLTGSIDAGIRTGALSSAIGADAQANGAQDFELKLRDIIILEAPVAMLERAVAGRPELRQALRHPNRTIIARILRPSQFEYRFGRHSKTGFEAVKGIGTSGTMRSAMTIESRQPLVIGIRPATLELRQVERADAAPVIRKLELAESRALQPDGSAALWPTGATITVGFLDGSPLQRRMFRTAMGEWLKHGNLSVSYVDYPAADIRVKFGEVGISYSYVGRRAKQVGQDEPTIILGYPPNSAGAQGAYLHEIGHSLGLVHEFQNPNAQEVFNRAALYKYALQTFGWSENVVDSMFFASNGYPGARPVDPNSVMSFPLPNEVYRPNFRFTPGNTLSPSDKKYFADLYPPSNI